MTCNCRYFSYFFYLIMSLKYLIRVFILLFSICRLLISLHASLLLDLWFNVSNLEFMLGIWDSLVDSLSNYKIIIQLSRWFFFILMRLLININLFVRKLNKIWFHLHTIVWRHYTHNISYLRVIQMCFNDIFLSTYLKHKTYKIKNYHKFLHYVCQLQIHDRFQAYHQILL